MRALNQILAITLMNLQNLPQRVGTSLVVVVGIAGVVGVLVAVLAMSEGFRYTLASTGRSDRVIMLHKESPHGRKPREEKLRMMWVNKSKVAWRYLPKKYFRTTALLWSLQFLRITGFNMTGFIKGWKEIAAIPRSEKREPLSPATLTYLKKLGARLWF